ncbi:disease resistance protein RPV1-like [Gastrolobium bilobum]|uniref:disease resistance protein RPV1-like n=1 Tax=Gastrolobium bilobum TaxID=150636 RepID=UPI002AB0FF47|nr:disease resistance protein RPV1-like [Gastrolobium bilobum]
MASSAVCSSSFVAFSPKKYDVFVSFRGEDTRSNFTSHLITALCQRSIKTFVDYKLERGEEISQALTDAIEDSNVSLIVFSENFASSKWCLEELTKILECKRNQGQVVIPVFYKVDPSHVRKHTMKQAFAKHEQDSAALKVNKWKASLTEAANLAGWDSRTYR